MGLPSMHQALTTSPAGLAMIAAFEDAAGAWRARVPEAEALVRRVVTAPMAQRQFDALVSFALSVDAAAFARSDVVRRFNQGSTLAAADALDAWRKASVNGELVSVMALARRRAAEKAMFLSSPTPQRTFGFAALADQAMLMASAPRGESHGETPPAPPPAANDSAPEAEARRLAAILASEPATAHVLTPPPAPARETVAEEPLPLPLTFAGPAPSARSNFGLRTSNHDGNRLGLLGLGFLGVVLVGTGFMSHFDGWGSKGAGLALFGAPGVLALLISVYYLVRRD